MSGTGLVSYFLGMEKKQLPKGVHISQRNYASDMLKKFKMFLCKLVTSPLVYRCKLSKDDGKKLVNPTQFRSIVGSLLYLTISRPDLAFATSFVSKFMGEPTSSHLGAAKRVLRYMKGSLDLGFMFERKKVGKLEGYAHSDWAGSIDDSKSTSGYILTLVAGAINHAIWIQKLLSDLDLTQEGPTVIFCDNKSAIAIAKNPVQMEGQSISIVLRHWPQLVYAFSFFLLASVVIADKSYGYNSPKPNGWKLPKVKYTLPNSPYIYKSPPPQVKHKLPYVKPYLHKSPPRSYVYKSPPPVKHKFPYVKPYLYKSPPRSYVYKSLPPPKYVYKSPTPSSHYVYKSPPPPPYVYKSPPPPPHYVYKSPPPPSNYVYKSSPPPPYVYKSPPPPSHYVYKSPPPPPYVYKSPPPTSHYVHKSPPPPPYIYKSPPPPSHYVYKSPPPPPYVYKSPPPPSHYAYKSPPPPTYVYKFPPLPPYVYKSPPPPSPSPPPPYEYKSPPPPSPSPPPPYTYNSPPPPKHY
nr:putative extensin domain-containing protein [Tanacetum cinerariifolium]